MLRSILHCDMNNFYASVECMLDPALKKYPIAVCGSVEERHGIVLAKNYKAKAFDVKTGDAVWQAKQKCKDLVVVPPHYEEYIKYSKLARSVYERYTDQVEPYGMDECWLDISGTESLFGSPEKVANEIRETMKFELGLTISVGVSFNKIFAKLGSDMKKPDAVTVIPKDTFKEKIWGLPAADLLGVGRATQRVLDSYCIRTIGDLANNDPEFLRRRLGKNGVVLWNYANGNDLSLVAKKDFVSPIKSVGHGITTVADLEKPEQVWPVFLELTQDIGHKLRVHGLSAEGVAIHIRDVCYPNRTVAVFIGCADLHRHLRLIAPACYCGDLIRSFAGWHKTQFVYAVSVIKALGMLFLCLTCHRSFHPLLRKRISLGRSPENQFCNSISFYIFGIRL